MKSKYRFEREKLLDEIKECFLPEVSGGGSCTADQDCISGYCVNGLCLESEGGNGGDCNTNPGATCETPEACGFMNGKRLTNVSGCWSGTICCKT